MDSKNTLRVEAKDLAFVIGKSTKGAVNVFCEFNPMKKLSIIDMIHDCESVDTVFNVSSYGSETGGFALQLKADKTELDLKASIEDILKALIV